MTGAVIIALFSTHQGMIHDIFYITGLIYMHNLFTTSPYLPYLHINMDIQQT